jgi:Transposase IS66 family
MGTTPRSRSSPKARPTPAEYGPMCATTGRSVGQRRWRRHSITRVIGAGEHPQAHLAGYTGTCWVHARRPFFVMADLAENARRKAQGKKPPPISPLALEAVRRIDALFDIERRINGQSAERRKAVRQEFAHRSSRTYITRS